MTKLFISQPMRGRRMADIVRERKTLVADAAVALQEDEIAVLDTLFDDTDATPLALLARALGKLAEADAVIFAPGWDQPSAPRCPKALTSPSTATRTAARAC